MITRAELSIPEAPFFRPANISSYIFYGLCHPPTPFKGGRMRTKDMGNDDY